MLINVQTNEQIEKEKKIETKAVDVAESAELITSLSAYVDTCWSEAKAEKIEFEKQLLINKRQIDGIYDPDKLAAIKEFGSSEIFVFITDTKCRNADAWVKDILFPPNEKCWGIRPTPQAEIPSNIRGKILETVARDVLQGAMNNASQGQPSDPLQIYKSIMSKMPEIEEHLKTFIQKKAKEIAAQMEVKINDQLTEGDWYDAVLGVLPDVIMGTGFVKGPILRKQRAKKVEVDPESSKFSVKIMEKAIPKYEIRPPFNIYPCPGSTGINDGYLFDRIQITPRGLQELIGIPGFDEKEIRLVLQEYEQGSLHDWLNLEIDRNLKAMDKIVTGSVNVSYNSHKIDCLEFWDAIQGKKLKEWGVTKKDMTFDDDLFYDLCVWKIGGHIIKVMFNPDKLGMKPFSKASFEEKSGSFWGRGLPQVIKDAQQAANACGRAIINNVAIGSGPQVERNIDRVPRSDIADNILYPWRVWDVTNQQAISNAPALKFYQPPMVVDKILTVFDRFIKIADEHSGVPAYAHGDVRVGGAGRALADYEKVLTPQGPVCISQLKAGDLVVNSYGSASTVTGVYPQGESDIFRLKFNNGKHVDCDMEHRWSVRTHHNRKFRTMTTEEILDAGLFRKTKKDYRNPSGWRAKWMLPLFDYIEFEEREVKIDPYTMGALIGNGDARCRLTCRDKEVFERIPYPLGKVDRKGDSAAWTHTVKGIKLDYLSYGLKCKSVDKFIPEDYLFNSRQIRLELLRGLMDTDGCCSKEGGTDYSSLSFRLINDFRILVESLGATVGSIGECEGGEFEVNGRKSVRQKAYRIKFNLPGEKLFYVPRKHKRVFDRKKTHTYITGIEYIGKHTATCITVDSRDSLFLCANLIPTHNTASGLSMLMHGAARGIKSLIKTIDEKIISSTVERQYYWNIEQKENFGLICDFQIEARGSAAMLAKEQQLTRMVEFAQATANEYDMKLMGAAGRAYIISEIAKQFGLDVDKAFPMLDAIMRQAEQRELGSESGVEGRGEESAGAMGGQGPAARTLDMAGNPAQGTDMNEFSADRG